MYFCVYWLKRGERIERRGERERERDDRASVGVSFSYIYSRGSKNIDQNLSPSQSFPIYFHCLFATPSIIPLSRSLFPDEHVCFLKKKRKRVFFSHLHTPFFTPLLLRSFPFLTSLSHSWPQLKGFLFSLHSYFYATDYSDIPFFFLFFLPKGWETPT